MTAEYTAMKTATKGQVWLLGAVLTLENLAAVLHQSSRVYLYQQTQCLNYYKAHDPTQIDRTSQIPELLCKIPQVQSPLAITDGIDSFLSCIPVSLHRSWTTNAILCSFIFDLLGGGEVMRITIITTCIAQITPPEKLTNVYNYISGIYLLATVSGSAIGSLLLSRHVYILNALSILCYIFTASVAATIPTACGHELEAMDDSQSILLANDQTHPPRSSLDKIAKSDRRYLVNIFLHSWKSSYLSIITLFNVPNPTFTVLLLFLTNYFAIRVEVLLPQYTSLTLHWPLSTVNSVLALKSLVSALALFALPSLRRRYLDPRMNAQQVDLFITQMSLVANAIGMSYASAKTLEDAVTALNIILGLFSRKVTEPRPNYQLTGDAAPTIDVLITCCGEPVGVIIDTVNASAAQDYPASKLRIFVLDDSRDEELCHAIGRLNVHLAVRHGPLVIYISREKLPGVRSYFKAGNLRFGIDESERLDGSEFLAGLDADMIPEPNWLSKMVPHLLLDDKLALACPPQRYYNIPHSDPLGQQAEFSMFFGFQEALNDRLGAAMCTGSGYIIDACMEVCQHFGYYLPGSAITSQMTALQTAVNMLYALRDYSPVTTSLALILLPVALYARRPDNIASPVPENINYLLWLQVLYTLTFIAHKINTCIMYHNVGLGRVQNFESHQIWASPCKLNSIPSPPNTSATDAKTPVTLEIDMAFRNLVSVLPPSLRTSTFDVCGAITSPTNERSGSYRSPLASRLLRVPIPLYIVYAIYAASALVLRLQTAASFTQTDAMSALPLTGAMVKLYLRETS
ncbi:MAG: hypothetical protein Q9223_001842 [Gallowayella weberi]